MSHWRHNTGRRKRKYFAWFQASTAKWTRNSLFWVIMQPVVAIPYRRFGRTYRSFIDGPIGCAETSVRNYHYSLRNHAEKRSSQGSTWRKTLVVPFSVVNSTSTLAAVWNQPPALGPATNAWTMVLFLLSEVLFVFACFCLVFQQIRTFRWQQLILMIKVKQSRYRPGVAQRIPVS